MLKIKTQIYNTHNDTATIIRAIQSIESVVLHFIDMSDTHCAVGTQLQPPTNFDITHSRHSGHLGQTVNWNLSSSKAIKQAIDNDARSLEAGYSQLIIKCNKCIYHLNTILYPW